MDFSSVVTLVVVVGGFAMAFVGVYLNYKYPKTEHERWDRERIEMQRATDALRLRAEACEELVRRSMMGGAGQSGGLHVSGGLVRIEGDALGGDMSKRDETRARGE